jgi:hypothetical protein
MTLEKQRRLVELLLQRTKAGKIEWKTTIDDQAFQVSFRDNTVHLSQHNRADGEFDYKITLLNAEGAVAEVFSDMELYEDQEELPPDQRKSYYKIMGDLYELARRAALGSDRILNSILDELDEDIKF